MTIQYESNGIITNFLQEIQQYAAMLPLAMLWNVVYSGVMKQCLVT